jgi:tryptophan synthase alpha chain
MDAACKANGIGTVYIIAPTSPESRIQRICRHATGFLYYVSQEGVTGERDQLADNLREKVELIRSHASQPLVVGFGISQPQHVKAVAAIADGVVVGSALVNCIARSPADKSAILAAITEKMQSLTQGLKKE